MTEELRRRVWILGLHHSGTTIHWRAWRKDVRFLCFDEPLTGDIGTCFPRNNDKKTFDEYIQCFATDPAAFGNTYRLIEPSQELDTDLTTAQQHYLNFLLSQSPRIVIDETHLHLHVSALAELTHAHVIHLYRRASGFATSHLTPSLSRDARWLRRAARRVRHAYNQTAFWTRRDFHSGMGRGEVIGQHPASKFGRMLAEAGYDAERIMTSTTLVRLLAYWHYHYHYLRREGSRHFDGRFVNLRYEDFAADPAETMWRLYDWIGLSVPPGVTYPEVHPAKPPFRESDRRWREAAKVAGFTDEETETLL